MVGNSLALSSPFLGSTAFPAAGSPKTRRRIVNTSRYKFALAAVLVTLSSVAGQLSARASDDALAQALGAQVDRFVAADRVAPPPHCQVLFVGSSSIVMWKETLVSDMAPIPVINRGFGGSHIEYINRWFDKIVAPYQPRAIVFYAGENDLDAGKSVGRVVTDFREFMARKTEALGATPVYFISVKPSKLRFAELPGQRKVNAVVRALAASRNDLYYVDVATSMLEKGKPKDIYLSDGLHMSREGYAIWSSAVRQAMLPRTGAEATRCQQHDKP